MNAGVKLFQDYKMEAALKLKKENKMIEDAMSEDRTMINEQSPVELIDEIQTLIGALSYDFSQDRLPNIRLLKELVVFTKHYDELLEYSNLESVEKYI